MAQGFVIAVDGPAASGKGTVAAGLARLYRLPHLDTGLLYRAVGRKVLEEGGSLDDQASAAAAAAALQVESLDPAALTTAAAGEAASRVAVHREVREALLTLQREFAGRPGGAVLDGRDIGTVIAPDAEAKLFVTATPEVRAERRWRQVTAAGERVAYAAMLDEIRRRDARDAERDAAPMVRAADAVLLDTTALTIVQVADEARRIVEAALARKGNPQR